jgi:hypothetical protein
LADDWRTAQESVQATAQSWFCHAARVSKGREDVNVKRCSGRILSFSAISLQARIVVVTVHRT